MNPKSFKEFIREDYLTRFGDVVVYMNPNKSDIKELLKSGLEFKNEIRFIADPETQTVYVWNSYLAVHNEILQKLKSARMINSNRNDIKYPFELGYGTIEGTIIHYKDQYDNAVSKDTYKHTRKESLPRILKLNQEHLSQFGFVEDYIHGYLQQSYFAKAVKVIKDLLDEES